MSFFLVSLLLFGTHFTPSSSVSILNFEQVIAGWVAVIWLRSTVSKSFWGIRFFHFAVIMYLCEWVNVKVSTLLLQITVKQESSKKNVYPKFDIKIVHFRLKVVLLAFWLPASLTSPFSDMSAGRRSLCLLTLIALRHSALSCVRLLVMVRFCIRWSFQI